MVYSTILTGAVVLLSCSLVTGGLLFGCDEPDDKDVNIYVRNHENKTCSVFHVLFPKVDKMNETTSCKCTKKARYTCKTIIPVEDSNTTSTTPAAQEQESGIDDVPFTDEDVEANKAFQEEQEEGGREDAEPTIGLYNSVFKY